MELRQYASVVWRRRWLVSGVVLVGIAIAWTTGGLARSQPRYRAVATLLMTSPPGQPLFYPVEAVRTLTVAKQAIRAAGAHEDADVVLRALTIAPRAGSSLVDIRIDDAHPARAARLANAFANAYLEGVRLPVDGTEALETLRKAHDALVEEAARLEASALDPARKQWEMRWLQVRDETVARAFHETQFRTLLGGSLSPAARLLEPATPPARPVESPWGRQARSAAGIAGVALIGALTLAFVLEYVDDRIRTESDAERAVALPVVATLPSRRRTARAVRRFSGPAPPPNPRGSGQQSLIPDPRLAEAFQALRVYIDLAARERPVRTLLVAAPHGSDKSAVAAFLGAVCAAAGRRVTLVSADLLRPEIESMFGVPASPGLGDAASGSADARSVVHRTRVHGVSVVPAGTVTGHPADVLASGSVARIFESLRQADMVIVEAPPVLASAEASILVPRCDAVLLVVQGGSTTREQALIAKTALEKVRNGASFLGVVLTNAPDGRAARRRSGRRNGPPLTRGAKARRASEPPLWSPAAAGGFGPRREPGGSTEDE